MNHFRAAAIPPAGAQPSVPTLEIDNALKHFAAFTGASLHVNPGEVAGLLVVRGDSEHTGCVSFVV